MVDEYAMLDRDTIGKLLSGATIFPCFPSKSHSHAGKSLPELSSATGQVRNLLRTPATTLPVLTGSYPLQYNS